MFTFFHHKTTKWSLFCEWVITAVVLCLVLVCRKMSARQAQDHNYQPLPRLSTIARAAFKCCRKHSNYKFSTHNRPNRAVLGEWEFSTMKYYLQKLDSVETVIICAKSNVVVTHCNAWMSISTSCSPFNTVYMHQHINYIADACWGFLLLPLQSSSVPFNL